MHKKFFILGRVKVFSTGRCSQNVNDKMWVTTKRVCLQALQLLWR